MLEVKIHRHLPDHPWTYQMLDRLQREVAARVENGGTGAILLSEVAPVISVAKRTAPTDVLMSKEALAALGIDLVSTDRGGMATYHGPGQWVLYVVDSLERLTGDRRGVRIAVESLLEIALGVCEKYAPRSEIKMGKELGVWTPQGKVASLGVRIVKGVLLHGIAINGFHTEKSFMGLRPCGLDEPVDYLLNEMTLKSGIVYSMSELSERFETLGQEILSAAQSRFLPQTQKTQKT
ncbi:hypothetical protein K2X30_10035 [bacterium]|jgi:lipoate-protein ligase B|nr:hypothetical protein [bacterium]